MVLAYDPFREHQREERQTKPEISPDRLSYRIGGKHVGEANIRGLEMALSANGQSDPCQPMHFTNQALPGYPQEQIAQSHKPPEEKLLKRMLPAERSRYVSERVSSRACRHWGLKYDERERRWVFPVRSPSGELVGLTARTVWEESWCFRCGMMFEESKQAICPRCHQTYMKYRHWPGKWRSKSVFGIHLCVPGESVVIVEGTTDAINLWEHGIRHPVAILGSNPNLAQMQSIAGIAGEVFVMGDGDEAGRKMNRAVEAAMARLDRACTIIELAEGQDPGELSPAEAHGLMGSGMDTSQSIRTPP